MKPIIQKIWQNKGNSQLLITIPKNSGLREGEYVKIERVLKGLKSELPLGLLKPTEDHTKRVKASKA